MYFEEIISNQPCGLEQFIEGCSPKLESSHENSPFDHHVCCSQEDSKHLYNCALLIK